MPTVEVPNSTAVDTDTRSEIKIRNPLTDSDWDSDLAACPQSTFYHTSAWSRILHETYGYTPYYFYSGSTGRPRAILPAMEVHSAFTGRRGVSLPFSDSCEPAGFDGIAYQQLFHHARLFGYERSWRYFECRGLEGYLPTAQASVRYFGHHVQLRQNENNLWVSFDSAVRRAIRKAERSGLTVEFANDAKATGDFYRLFCQTRKRHGLPPQPFSFYENIRRYGLEPGSGLIVLVRLQKRAVAGALFLHCGKSVMMKFAASDQHFLHLRINNLALWEAMRHYSRAGFTAMDLGRTSVWNQGLRRFKQRWGAVEHQIDYQRFDYAKGEFVKAEDKSSGAKTLFKYLPAAVAQIAGTLLYRHVA